MFGGRPARNPLMAMTFDATLKDMGRDSAPGFLASFDQPPTRPVKLLNVDLSTVTTAADLLVGLGEPLAEIVHLDVPLAMLGRLPEGLSLEEGLAAVAQRVAERVVAEATPDRAKKLLTDAYLLTGLRIRRDAAARIFRGVRVMHESDTYLAILDEGQEKATREAILLFGEEKIGLPDESIKAQLHLVTDLDRLRRMVRRTAKAASWQEILETP
jgi:hypothetical protein